VLKGDIILSTNQSLFHFVIVIAEELAWHVWHLIGCVEVSVIC